MKNEEDSYFERIGKREFLHFPNKYLKQGAFILTKNGKDKYFVEVTDIEMAIDAGDFKSLEQIMEELRADHPECEDLETKP